MFVPYPGTVWQGRSRRFYTPTAWIAVPEDKESMPPSGSYPAGHKERIKTNGVMFVNSTTNYLNCTLWRHQLGFTINKAISRT